MSTYNIQIVIFFSPGLQLIDTAIRKELDLFTESKEIKFVATLVFEFKRHYVLIKDFNTFMYYHTLH